MKTFLQTGIINEFSFDISTVMMNGLSIDELSDKVARTVVDSPDSFSCEFEDCAFYRWSLKREVRQKHLIPLLTRYYADFYGLDIKDFAAFCKPVIGFLRNDPSDDDLIRWAKEGTFGNFYLTEDWFRIAIVHGQKVRVNVSLVSLSSEGKVRVGKLQQHLPFFEKALRSVYGDNPLGKCLTVDVG